MIKTPPAAGFFNTLTTGKMPKKKTPREKEVRKPGELLKYVSSKALNA